jgi:hypothetical protein
MDGEGDGRTVQQLQIATCFVFFKLPSAARFPGISKP